jgi:hypothetical protein
MESEAIARRYYSRPRRRANGEGKKRNTAAGDDFARHRSFGHFSGGGLALNFNDGRTSRTKLCIRVLDVSRVIVEINHLFGPPV